MLLILLAALAAPGAPLPAKFFRPNVSVLRKENIAVTDAARWPDVATFHRRNTGKVKAALLSVDDGRLAGVEVILFITEAGRTDDCYVWVYHTATAEQRRLVVALVNGAR